jgi:hypothetical protein
MAGVREASAHFNASRNGFLNIILLVPILAPFVIVKLLVVSRSNTETNSK